MNLKTTLVLLFLVVAGGALFFVEPVFFPGSAGTTPDAGSCAVLEQELTADKVKTIRINRGNDRIVFERGPGNTWTLPGGWLTRTQEVEHLVGLVTGLTSRFAPIPLTDETGLRAYGLDAPAVTVELAANNKEYRLSFGEEPASENRFSRATYVQLADRDGKGWKPRDEVVRLGPGMVAALDRPADYYQQRRLFPSDRVARDGGGEKVYQLKADQVAVKDAKGGFTLHRSGDPSAGDWTVTVPLKDRPDPDKMKGILRNLADVWAERFVSQPKADLAEYGLDKPEQSITVLPAGAKKPITLVIGKESGELKKQVLRQPPPGPPGMPRLDPVMETVSEKLRYAKLADNAQVFEVKVDPLKDVLVEFKDIRDPRLARFRAEDAVRLEVVPGKGDAIVLAKQDGKWKLEKPQQVAAETAKVTELLDKLELLRASGDDLLDQADAKELKLDPAASKVVIDVEEEIKTDSSADAKKEKKKRTITFLLGKHDAEKKKLYAKVEGWPRVNVVDDEVLKLVDRPAVAYRGRSIFDFAGNDLAGIEVQQPAEKFALKQKDGVWRLSAPVDAEADTSRAGKLAGDLSRLSAVEHVVAEAKPEDLEKEYGLDKDAPAVTMTFKEETKKAPLRLRIGKQRGTKEEFFAKLDAEPGIFVVDKAIRDAVVQSSLSYRPTLLWRIQPPEIKEIKVQKQGEDEYRLVKSGEQGWKVTGPFDAAVHSPTVQLMVEKLAPLVADRFIAHDAKDGKEYGLDQPVLRITILTGGGDPKDAKDTDKPIERVLLIGGPTKSEAPGRFAKLGKSPAVFVVGLLDFGALDQSALNLLERKLLALERKNIVRVESISGASRMVLDRKGDVWTVSSAEPPFAPDSLTLEGLLTVWTKLDAERYAAYGPKIDWAKYGLDQPAVRLTVTMEKEKDKTELHSIALGQPVGDPKGPRYARIDEGPSVAILAAPVVAELNRIQLDFVDHQLLKLNPSVITAIQRRMGADELELSRRDNGWFIAKPAEQRADDQTLDKLTKDLAGLRVQRVVAYHSKDFRVFGLDDPAAVITIRYLDGENKPAEKVLKIGETADPPGVFNGDRFAMVEGTPVIGTLSGPLVRLLTGKPVVYRDRTLARFASADRVILERGPRLAVFANIDGSWKQLQPVMGEAEQAGLDDFINAIARLRADELVADKPQPTPQDLQPFGLDRPQARWRFIAGDKEVLALAIGGREKVKDVETGRVFGRIGDSDLVFLLDPKIAQLVQGEYRRRALWPPVDAFQVERLEFQQSTNPFTLVKAGNDWQLAGKPEQKLRSEAVNDTVAALANLKAERTVIDKDADPKLFNLDPPVLVIELQASSGKRTLAIGGPEGDSKRRYARVIGGNRDDVFVLSEADGAKLTRPLEGYLAK